MNQEKIKKLKAAATDCHGWSWPDRNKVDGTHQFGKRDEDGNFNEVGTIDASNYTGDYADDIKVLKFIRAAQPTIILELIALAECTTSPVQVEVFSTHEVIGKIIDQMSQLQMLWGLNEPGALVRFREVSDVLFAASRACRASLAAAAPQAQAEPVQLGPDWRAIAEGHALQACYLQEKFDGLLAEMEKLPVKGGGYYIRRDAAIALFEHRVSYVSANDPISAIVDRDTPPDNRDEVVDHDIRGTPITRGMVAAAATIPKKDDLPDLLQARQAFLEWNRALAAERKPIVLVGGEYAVFDKVIEFALAKKGGAA